MAQLASEMRQIKSFLHVSTAYVNCHLGRNVHVEERQYPFTVNGRPVSHAHIIAELAALAPEAAERRVSPLIPSVNPSQAPSVWNLYPTLEMHSHVVITGPACHAADPAKRPTC